MRTHIRLLLPHSISQTERVAPLLAARPAAVTRVMVRRAVAVPTRATQPASVPFSPPVAVQTNPYVDYSRSLTAEGGILFSYKDLDKRLRHTVWRVFIWTSFTAMEGRFLFHNSPLHAHWLNWFCLIAIAIINWLIVAKPVETYRTVEIRPDCMILEGKDIFWLGHMEGRPSFRPKKKNQICCGIYGTRFVEYFTVRRFDKLDRRPAVFVGHLQHAMQKLWTGLH